jgi:hypothetical protein
MGEARIEADPGHEQPEAVRTQDPEGVRARRVEHGLAQSVLAGEAGRQHQRGARAARAEFRDHARARPELASPDIDLLRAGVGAHPRHRQENPSDDEVHPPHMADADPVHGPVAQPHPFGRRAVLHAYRRGHEPADHRGVAARAIGGDQVVAGHDLKAELEGDLGRSDMGEERAGAAAATWIPV